MKSRLIQYVADAVRNPREQLTRGQHFVRHSFELTVYCWHQLQRHRAEGMAAELTYRTIFSLIPVVVLGLVMFRVVGGLEDVQSQVEDELYTFFGFPEIPDDYLSPAVEASEADQEAGTTEEMVIDPEVAGQSESASSETVAVAEDVAPATAAETSDPAEPDARPSESTEPGEVVNLDEAIAVAEKDQQSEDDVRAATEREVRAETGLEARANIRRALSEITEKVSSVDFKSIGVFGLLLFIYAAVALADSVEHLFNRIYEAPSQRPIHIRLAIHWSIITLGSGLLAMSLYLSGQVVDWFVAIGAGSTTRYILSHALSIAASWVLLFLLYALMPNTHVSVRAAMTGALVGSLLWEGAKFGFQIYVAKAVPYSAIYGSIGLIPLFLFWVYVTWLIILFGLILTYTLQTLRGRPLGPIDRNEEEILAGDPDWMLPIMCEIGHAFREGKVIDDQELADRLGLSSRVVRGMTSKLIESGMLRKVTTGAGGSDSLILARPAEKITIDEILALAHQVRPTNQHPAWQTLAGLKQAERAAAGGKTLSEV